MNKRDYISLENWIRILEVGDNIIWSPPIALYMPTVESTLKQLQYLYLNNEHCGFTSVGYPVKILEPPNGDDYVVVQLIFGKFIDLVTCDETAKINAFNYDLYTHKDSIITKRICDYQIKTLFGDGK